MYAINKHTGVQIQGTLERLHACAQASEDSFQRDSDGNITCDYEGGTEVYWDDSVTVQQEDQTVFIDEHGHEVTQDSIILVDKLPADGA